jgi:hypothetical protein
MFLSTGSALTTIPGRLPRLRKERVNTPAAGKRSRARRVALSALLLAAAGYIAPGAAHADSGYVSVSSPLNVLTGQPLGNIVLATTEFIPSFNVLGAPNPQVNWGDGTPTDYLNSDQVGCNVVGAEIHCALVDPHSYQNPGTYFITVTYNTGAAIWYSTSIEAVVSVPSPTAIIPSTFHITPTEGAPFSGTAALFLDDNATDPASAYQATLNWGDGSPTVTGTVTGGGGYFGVSGSHTYALAGTYQVDAKVTDQYGATDVYSTARVQDAPLTANGANFSAAVGTAFTGNIGGFLDAGLAAPASQYTLSIDWGDGSGPDTASGVLSPTGVAAPPEQRAGSSTSGSPAPADPSSGGSAQPAPPPPATSNAWNISGTHTYATAGTYTVTTTITDTAGGSTASAVSTANVAAAAPIITPVPAPTTPSPTPAPVSNQGNGQVLVLDSGANSCNLTVQGGTLTTDNLAVNGGSAGATCLNGGSITAKTTTLQGGIRNQGGTLNTGNLVTGQSTADPLVGLTAPSVPSLNCPGAACPDGTNFNSGQTYNLLPGYYNGWLNFNSGSIICLAPGTYYVDGGWNLDSELFPYGSKACPNIPGSGSDAGVTLYFHSGGLQVNTGGSTLLLSAPQSGPYAGILYWQAGANGLYPNGKIGGNGAWYAPQAQLVLNSGVTFNANQVIVKDLTVNGNANLSAPDGTMTIGYSQTSNTNGTLTGDPSTTWSETPNMPPATATPTTTWAVTSDSGGN